MRFDKKVSFVEEGEEVYDPTTGDYIDGVEVLITCYANVSHTGLERREVLFGSVDVDRLTMRFRNGIPEKFDYILYEGNKYQVDVENNFRNKVALIVSEIK